MTRCGKTDDMNVSRHEDKTWQIIGAFVVACALTTALLIAMML
jgi:hypothetical protein